MTPIINVHACNARVYISRHYTVTVLIRCYVKLPPQSLERDGIDNDGDVWEDVRLYRNDNTDATNPKFIDRPRGA